MNKYRTRYSWARIGIKGNAYEVHVKDFEAPTPISALNQFHAFMQHERERLGSGIGEVVRPALKPTEYALISLHQFYHDAHLHANPSAQPIIESLVDLPKSTNPDLTKIIKAAGAFEAPPELF